MPEFEAGTFTVGTLLGMLLGAFLGHALAIRRSKFQVRHNAAIEFRKILMPAVLDIERGKHPIEIVTNSFPAHFDAAREYAVYLKARDFSRFNELLAEYKGWHKVMCNRTASDRMHGNDEPSYVEMSKINPTTYLYGLLEYAGT